MRIVGYHASNRIIANSDGEFATETPYLDFLLEPKPDSIKVFYHIGYNVANVLAMIDITKEEAKKLHDTEELYLSPYKLKYAPNKFFNISKGFYKGNPYATFCDMNQYSSARLDDDDTPAMCLVKAIAAKKTGEQVYNALCLIGLHPTTIASPVRAYEKEVLDKMNLPTVDDMPEDAGEYAYMCCKGNWLEAFQLGHWERAWDYDINSAYPAELAKLPDLRVGEWQHTDSFYEDGLLGYYKGKVTIKAPFSPIIYTKEGKGSGDLNYTPVGTWDTYLTRQEIDFIYKWNLGTFEVEDGWYWELTKDRKNLLEGTIEWLHQQKEAAEGLEKEVIKRVMSGIYGKFLETWGGNFGQKFNPVYGAEVEVNSRLAVAEFAIQNGLEHIIHIAVDGVILDKSVELSEVGIGTWKSSGCSPCFVAETGQVAIKDREGVGDFSLSYDWLKYQILLKPEASGYTMRKQSPVTLAVALNGNWEKLGQLHETTRTVDISNEMKRAYKEKPKNGQELLSKKYRSEPWDTSLVSKLT